MTHVRRDYQLTTTGMLNLLHPMLRRGGRQESERILRVLKAHLEG